MLAILSNTFHREDFFSCSKLTKTAQKKANYSVVGTSNYQVGIFLKDDFIVDISSKTGNFKEFYSENIKNVSVLPLSSKLRENSFFLKPKLEKKNFMSSFKNFLKSTIKGVTENCHELLKNDEIIDLVLRFCKEDNLNISKPPIPFH